MNLSQCHEGAKWYSSLKSSFALLIGGHLEILKQNEEDNTTKLTSKLNNVN